jgi:hypothetical protein
MSVILFNHEVVPLDPIPEMAFDLDGSTSCWYLVVEISGLFLEAWATKTRALHTASSVHYNSKTSLTLSRAFFLIEIVLQPSSLRDLSYHYRWYYADLISTTTGADQ